MTETILAAGRELDALIAEKVFGHTTKMVEYLDSYSVTDKDGKHFESDDPDRVNLRKVLVAVMERDQIMYGHWECDYHVRLNVVPHYSTDIAAAWLVVEKMGDGKNFALAKGPEHWTAGFSKGDNMAAENAKIAPHVICLAALEAIRQNPS